MSSTLDPPPPPQVNRWGSSTHLRFFGNNSIQTHEENSSMQDIKEMLLLIPAGWTGRSYYFYSFFIFFNLTLPWFTCFKIRRIRVESRLLIHLRSAAAVACFHQLEVTQWQILGCLLSLSLQLLLSFSSFIFCLLLPLISAAGKERKKKKRNPSHIRINGPETVTMQSQSVNVSHSWWSRLVNSLK